MLLENVKVYWASVIKPNSTFEPANWEIQAVITDAQAKRLMDEAKAIHPKGIKIKEDEALKAKVFRFKRRAKKADGTDNNPPVVVDKARKPFTSMIGNGSLCNIQYNFVKYDKFSGGVFAELKGVQVVDLVPYGVADGEEFSSLEDNRTTDEGFDDDDFKDI